MSNERPEGHDTVISKGECPKCGSRKGFVTYADGHSHCFGAGCDHWLPSTGQSQSSSASSSGGRSMELPSPLSSTPPQVKSRGLSADTLRSFGVYEYGYGGGKTIGFPYHDTAGDPVAIKMRYPDKDRGMPLAKGSGYKSLEACRLFGHHVFGDRFDRQVVVTEGEFDAMSVAQATDFKLAAVSINTGAGGAAQCLKANYLWLDRFAEIILWFDNDAPGREAAEECAKLFKVGKVRIATAADGKDASDVLQANRPGDIKTAIYTAQAWRPKGIVNAADAVEDVLAPSADDSAFAFEWPWAELTDTLGPMLPGQVIYHVAGTGVGKSTAVATIAFHVIEQGGKVAYMSFEGTRREIKLALMVVHSGKRVDIEALPDADMRFLHEAAFGSRRIELFDPETAEWSVEAILGYVRYVAKALDCQVVVIDPLSFVIAGMRDVANPVQALDLVARDVSALAKELGVHIQISHHLRRTQGVPHEEGAPTSLNELRGSGSLANFATTVIGHERNQQAGGEAWRLTQLRSLKNRPRSKTGPMVVLEYSIETGQLAKSAEPFPAPGKGEDGDGPRRGGFAPATSDDY